MRHNVLTPPRRQHQLKQDSLLELFDSVDDGAALIPANRPRGEDPSGRKHVHAKRDVANPSFPHSSSLLFLLLLLPH